MSVSPRRERPRTHVLVLEDDGDLRRVLVDLLDGEGFEVSTRDSYSALRKALHDYAGSIILADFWGTSHSELSLRERDEVRDLGREAPAILLTGRAWVANAVADDLNVVCILPKPIELEQILEQIRRCLDLAAESP
jgi:two-component system, NtrC family, nitrogen regulation response regulator NtrX